MTDTIYPIRHRVIGDPVDKRYTVRKEWCGYRAQRYVLRFCGDMVSNHIAPNEACKAAKKHYGTAIRLHLL